MYRFSLIMFYLSTVGVFLNIILIIINKNNPYDYMRAISLLVFSAVFLFLKGFYKKREEKRKK